MLFPAPGKVIDFQDQGTYDPSCRIGKADDAGRIGNGRGDEQVCLTEKDEGEQQNDHRNFRVSRASYACTEKMISWDGIKKGGAVFVPS